MEMPLEGTELPQAMKQQHYLMEHWEELELGVLVIPELWPNGLQSPPSRLAFAT